MLVGYARVSTRDQSPALQRSALQAAGCGRLFEETASGARFDRPQLAAALDYMRDGDTLVVWRLDRLARSNRQLIETVENLAERGIGFRSLKEAIDTTSAGGTLIFHVFSALAQFERGLIRERTLAGLEEARSRGRVGGRPAALDERGIAVAGALPAGPLHSDSGSGAPGRRVEGDSLQVLPRRQGGINDDARFLTPGPDRCRSPDIVMWVFLKAKRGRVSYGVPTNSCSTRVPVRGVWVPVSKAWIVGEVLFEFLGRYRDRDEERDRVAILAKSSRRVDQTWLGRGSVHNSYTRSSMASTCVSAMSNPQHLWCWTLF